MSYQVVLCTCPDEITAELIANALVTEKLAACVNIINNVCSIYSWQDQVVKDREIQLVIKTAEHLYDRLADKIKQLHPYQVPEIIALKIQQGDSSYLDWINTTLQ